MLLVLLRSWTKCKICHFDKQREVIIKAKISSDACYFFLSTSVSNELNIFTDILLIVKSLPLFLISFEQFQYRRHQLWQEGNAVRFKSTEHFCCTEQRA